MVEGQKFRSVKTIWKIVSTIWWQICIRKIKYLYLILLVYFWFFQWPLSVFSHLFVCWSFGHFLNRGGPKLVTFACIFCGWLEALLEIPLIHRLVSLLPHLYIIVWYLYKFNNLSAHLYFYSRRELFSQSPTNCLLWKQKWHRYWILTLFAALYTSIFINQLYTNVALMRRNIL